VRGNRTLSRSPSGHTITACAAWDSHPHGHPEHPMVPIRVSSSSGRNGRGGVGLNTRLPPPGRPVVHRRTAGLTRRPQAPSESGSQSVLLTPRCTLMDSNHRHPACHPGALAAKLRVRLSRSHRWDLYCHGTRAIDQLYSAYRVQGSNLLRRRSKRLHRSIGRGMAYHTRVELVFRPSQGQIRSVG
jgi:hypothetical protein